MKLFSKVVLVSLLSVMSSMANANLIEGGDFDSTTDLSDWVVTVGSSGSAAIAVGPAFGLGPQAGAGYLAFTGNDSVFNVGGKVHQLISGLTVGETYKFSYFYGGRGSVDATDPTVTASLSSGTSTTVTGDIFTQTNNTNAVVGNWNMVMAMFTATTTDLLVSFQETSGDSRSKGPAIDSASLVQVSTPSTFAILLLGALSLVARRKV